MKSAYQPNILMSILTFSFRYGKLGPFTHLEHGKDGDPTFPDLLTDEATVVDLTANIGAEVSGVQLHRLSEKGKDQLALFVAQKKVVGRDQMCIHPEQH